MLKDYDIEIQKLFIQMMLTNAELYTRVMNIMNPQNFDKSLRPVAEMFKEHSDKYNVLPDSSQVKAVTSTPETLARDGFGSARRAGTTCAASRLARGRALCG